MLYGNYFEVFSFFWSYFFPYLLDWDALYGIKYLTCNFVVERKNFSCHKITLTKVSFFIHIGISWKIKELIVEHKSEIERTQGDEINMLILFCNFVNHLKVPNSFNPVCLYIENSCSRRIYWISCSSTVYCAAFCISNREWPFCKTCQK